VVEEWSILSHVVFVTNAEASPGNHEITNITDPEVLGAVFQPQAIGTPVGALYVEEESELYHFDVRFLGPVGSEAERELVLRRLNEIVSFWLIDIGPEILDIPGLGLDERFPVDMEVELKCIVVAFIVGERLPKCPIDVNSQWSAFRLRVVTYPNSSCVKFQRNTKDAASPPSRNAYDKIMYVPSFAATRVPG
jgi:hypothetical protein